MTKKKTRRTRPPEPAAPPAERPEDKLGRLGRELGASEREWDLIRRGREEIVDPEVPKMGKIYRDREGNFYRVEKVVDNLVEIYDFNSGERTMQEDQEFADWQARELVLVEHSDQGVFMPGSGAIDAMRQGMREQAVKHCKKLAHHDAYIQFTRDRLREQRQKLAKALTEGLDMRTANQAVVHKEQELMLREEVKREAQARGDLQDGDYCRDEAGTVVDQATVEEAAIEFGRDIWDRVEGDIGETHLMWVGTNSRRWYGTMIKALGAERVVRQRAVEKLRRQLEAQDNDAGRMIVEEQLRYQEIFFDHFDGTIRNLEAEFRRDLPQIEAAEEEEKKKQAALQERQRIFRTQDPNQFREDLKEVGLNEIEPVQHGLQRVNNTLERLSEQIDELPLRQRRGFSKVWNNLADRLWGVAKGGIIRERARQGGLEVELKGQIDALTKVWDEFVRINRDSVYLDIDAEEDDLMRLNSNDLEEFNEIVEKTRARFKDWRTSWGRLRQPFEQIATEVVALEERLNPSEKEPAPEETS